MPATRAAAAITDGYRQRLITLRDSAAEASAALLADIDLDRPPRAISQQLETWRTRSATLTNAAGRQAAAMSASYLSAYLIASGAARMSVGLDAIEPDPSGLVSVRSALLWRLGQRQGREAAMFTAAATARRVGRDIVTVPAVATLTRGISAEPQISGWRRATSTSCCHICADLADRTFSSASAFDRHPACRCTHEPVVLGRAETFRRQAPAVVAT